VPAFPLDGGRIARAAVWRISGSKRQGTETAAKLGQGFAVLLAGVGIWLMLSYRSFTGLWLIAIAFLLGQSARGALMQTALTERIEGVTVGDVMDPQPVAIPAETAVGEALDSYFLRYGWPWFPVIDDTGHLLGIAQRERIQAAYDGGEGWLTARAVLDADAGMLSIDESRPLTDALSSESFGKLGAVMAVDREGVLRGVLTADRVRRALQSAFGPAV
jgi:CBS domain-containing protein